MAAVGGAGGGVAVDLMQRLERRDATVGVVGLGYVGLPLVVAFAKAGMRVIGVDADAGRLVLDTRNLTGPLGAQPHVIRL